VALKETLVRQFAAFARESQRAPGSFQALSAGWRIARSLRAKPSLCGRARPRKDHWGTGTRKRVSRLGHHRPPQGGEPITQFPCFGGRQSGTLKLGDVKPQLVEFPGNFVPL